MYETDAQQQTESVLDGDRRSVQVPIEVMKALYAPEGGRPLAFVCLKCLEPTRTKKGMWSHLRVVHKIEKQPKLKFEEVSAA